MSKHTPGPWFVRTIDESIGSIDSENGVMVAQAQQVSSKDQLNGSQERKANAQLIAAAPELLEALQHLFNSYKSLADSGDAGNWKIEDQPEGIKALAAIRKATGE